MILELLNNIFYFVVALSILVAFHEYGHYWVAVRCGVKVERFSIGFGKTLLKWQGKETEFVIAIIPLGGYVKMQGDNSIRQSQEQLSPQQSARSFDNKSVYQRIAIVAAGPIANFILALLFYWILALAGKTTIMAVIAEPPADSVAAIAGLREYDQILSVDDVKTPTWNTVPHQLIRRVGDTGSIQFEVRTFETQQQPVKVELPIEQWLSDSSDPDPLLSLGLQLYIPPMPAVVKSLVEGGAASKAGLIEGDKILSINQQPIENWSQWRDWIRRSPNQLLFLEVERSNAGTLDLLITPEHQLEANGKAIGVAGVMSEPAMLPESMIKMENYSIIGALFVAFGDTYQMIKLMLVSVKKLVFGELSIKTLGGPITIAQYAGASASIGWQSFLSLLAILSVSLGVLNLLPIPALDGGRLVFYFYEFISGKALPIRLQEIALGLGMLMIAALMIFAVYNDFSRF